MHESFLTGQYNETLRDIPEYAKKIIYTRTVCCMLYAPQFISEEVRDMLV